jgi:hypothetical protein
MRHGRDANGTHGPCGSASINGCGNGFYAV